MDIRNSKVLFNMMLNPVVLHNFISLHKKFSKSKDYRPINLIRCSLNVIKNERLVSHEGKYIINSFFPPVNSKAFYRIAMRVPGTEEQFYINHTIGKRLAPISTYIAVTNRCMYHCWHCSANHFMEHRSKDLTTEELLTVTEKIKKLGVGIIGFTGGEPLLRKDLEQAISLAARGSNMPCMTLLFTTGYGLTLERAMALKEAGLFGIAISLDHIHAKDHDQMRGVEGAFVHAMNAIQYAKLAGLYTMTQTMCTRELLETGEIMKIAKLAKSLGVDEMRIMEPIPCGTLNEHRDEVLTAEEQKALIDLHIKMNRSPEYPKVSVFPYVESENQYGCGAGSQHSFVDASGNFGPCDFLPISYGNLLEEEATRIWRRMHQDIGKPKCKCYAKCKKSCDKLPKYYRLLAGKE